MVPPTLAAATLADLHRFDGKAELIAGKVVPLMPTGYRPGKIAVRIYNALDAFATRFGRGVALPDNIGFAVPELASGRESFSPDAAYYLGPLPADDMEFIPGPPALAVEVRSKSDYGPAAELDLAAKRADYFEAGTAIVWDVDPLAKSVRIYRMANTEQPTIFSMGQSADAEPILPGWMLDLDGLFA